MSANLFMDTIDMICKMASTNLIKAASKSGYMEELYRDIHHEKLETAIRKISKDFRNEIFGESDVLEKCDWLERAHLSKHSWLFSFDSIRKKVHQLSDV